MPILLVVSLPLAIRAFISVLDNRQLLCSTSGPPSGPDVTGKNKPVINYNIIIVILI